MRVMKEDILRFEKGYMWSVEFSVRRIVLTQQL